MAWMKLHEGRCLLQLTDGYLSPNESAVRGTNGTSPSREQNMANRLLSLGARPRPERTPETRAGALHVWVIGQSGWLNGEMPEPIRSIGEDDANDLYRVVIIGEELPSDGAAYINRWPGWVYRVGMTRQKPPRDVQRFRVAGEALLGIMYDHYDQTGRPGTAILEQLEVPFIYRGINPKDATPRR